MTTGRIETNTNIVDDWAYQVKHKHR